MFGGVYGPSLVDYSIMDMSNLVQRHWQFLKHTALRGKINRSITDLVHVLIGDNVSSTCIGRIVLQWYMQQQEICESGRFQPRAKFTDQRSRLKEVERILERYVTHNNSVHIVDKAIPILLILSGT